MLLFFIFLKQELSNDLKNLGLFVQNILFFIISCAIFLIMAQNQVAQGQNAQSLLTNIILISLVFSLIFANNNFLGEDFKDGTLEQMIIYCENLEVFIAAKMIVNWVIFALPLLLATPLMILASGLSQGFARDGAILFLLASFSINFICAFCASLNLAANKAPIIAIFVLPLIVPIILITLIGFVGAEGFSSSVKILSGLAVLSAVVTIFATTRIVRIANE